MVCTKGLKVVLRLTSAFVPSLSQRHTYIYDRYPDSLASHEPAWSCNTEDIQIVLDVAAQEPSLGVEAVGVETSRQTGQRTNNRCTRPIGPGVTAIDVRKHIRGDRRS